MRIGMDVSVAALRGSGTARYAHHLVRRLVDGDRENEYVLYFRGADAATNPLVGLRAPHVDRRIIDVRSTLVRLHLRLPSVLRRDRIDLYHSLGFFLPWLWRGKAIVTIHDIHPVLFPQHWKWPGTRRSYFALRAHIPLSLRRARVVLAQSAYTKETICRIFGVPAAKIVVTPLGVDPFFFAPPTGAELDAAAQRVGPGAFFLYVGALSPMKNLTGLVDAFARVRRQRADLRLLIVGRPAGAYWERSVAPLIGRLGLEGSVVLATDVDDSMLRALYRRATALVLPSFAEGFGLPILEAMACGTAVVASATSALPEVAGEGALFVDPHDPETLADALERLLAEPDLREALAAKGPARASSFTWDRTAHLTLDAYARCR
jgi:glycosyltransferase involved in cell wall biosynthesis